jgi:hypothetical protein
VSETGTHHWSRRAFIAGGGTFAGAMVVGLGACSGDDGGDNGNGGGGGSAPTAASGGERSADGVISEGDVVSEETMYGWIEEVVDQGIRRPGYPADEWAEGYIRDAFEEFGLSDVRLQPVTAEKWEPTEWSLEVTAGGQTKTLDCFPVPYSKPTDGLEAELVTYNQADHAAMSGKVAIGNVGLVTVPALAFVGGGSAPADTTRRVYDPEGTLTDAQHITPLATGLDVEAVAETGAVAFIGALKDYPGDSYEYFYRYDAEHLPIPAVYVRGSDGAWLDEQLAAGPVQVKLVAQATFEDIETHNVIGELEGTDDEVVIVGSHHDGPWASAVEDGTGIAMVLAQASYWAAQPVEDRPHRMMFVLHAAHMAGWPGQGVFIESLGDTIDRTVLEVHLEHAAKEFVEEDGELVDTGLATPRWFFTSRNTELEESVYSALEAERLDRSLILAPDVISGRPPTDGVGYYDAGVPIVNLLGAPFYLFDAMDTMDKVDREHLVAITRTFIRIIDGTRGVTAADTRVTA